MVWCKARKVNSGTRQLNREFYLGLVPPALKVSFEEIVFFFRIRDSFSDRYLEDYQTKNFMKLENSPFTWNNFSIMHAFAILIQFLFNIMVSLE